MNAKQENFKRIAENRVNKIIDMISKLENLNNTSFYVKLQHFSIKMS